MYIGNEPAALTQAKAPVRLINVNPHFQIDQYREGATVYPSSGSQRTVDGWTSTDAGLAEKFTVQRITDPVDATQKCIEVKVTVAQPTPVAGTLCAMYTCVEGFDAAVLKAGTAGSKKVTVQFALQTSLIGTYCVVLKNGAFNRSYIVPFTVIDTAEHDYSLTVTMDTAGTWLYDNGIGLAVAFALATGASAQSTAGSWLAGNLYSTSAQVNFMGTVGNTLRLKRFEVFQADAVQAVTPTDFAAELAKCQRYYSKTYPTGTPVGTVTTDGYVGAISNGYFLVHWDFPCEMRAIPTVTAYNTQNGASGQFSSGVPSNFAVSIAGLGTGRTNFYSGAAPAANLATGHGVADARIS